MTGLVLKDMLVMRKTLKTYVLFLAFYLLLAVIGLFPISTITAVTQIIIMMLPLSAFSFDELAKWDRYALTFPTGRRSLVGARYLFTLVMAAADLVLCRAGASTISEITAIAKPSVLVPSPNVTANHQEKNARVLADQGAAILLREQDCGEHTLYDTVELLMQERDRRDAMVRALNAMAVPNAGEKIYQTLREIMRDKA